MLIEFFLSHMQSNSTCKNKKMSSHIRRPCIHVSFKETKIEGSGYDFVAIYLFSFT